MNVSIIIPAHNAAGTIGEALQSLLAQSHRDWEAIVVDDGSTDETAAVTAGYAEKDNRIRLVRLPRVGVNAARNKGIELGSFGWLYFLDADDWILPAFLERMTEELKSDPGLDGVHCGWANTAPDGLKLDETHPTEKGDLFDIFAQKNIFTIHSCVVRRELVEAVGGFDDSFSITHDWDLWQRIARSGANFGLVHDVLVYYRMRPSSGWLDPVSYLSEGIRVITNGHSRDPRVPNPAPAHVNGRPAERLAAAKLHFACWPAGIAMGRGGDATPLLSRLDGVEDHALDPLTVAIGIFYGVAISRCQPPSVWGILWDDLEEKVDRFLDRLESLSGTLGLARGSRSILDKLVAENSVEQLRARIEMLILERDQSKNQIETLIHERDQNENQIEALSNERDEIKNRMDEREALIDRILRKPWVRLGLQLGLMKRPSELKHPMTSTRNQTVKRQSDPRALILMYHRVAEVHPEPWNLCVSPSHFAEHLEVLRDQAHTLSLSGLLESLDQGTLQDRTVVVTFDDGYADNLHQARPLLERYGIPGTFFLTSGCIGRDREFWWDELERILFQPGTLPETLHLEINGIPRRWKLGEAAHWSADDVLRHRDWRFYDPHPDRRHQVFIEIYQFLQPLPDNEQWKLLDEIRTWANVRVETRLTHRTLSNQEAIELSHGGPVEIGSHTVTHPVLSALTLPAQQDELERSKSDLEKLLNRTITSFAYPYGGSHVYTPETVRAVRDAGYQGACTTTEGIVRNGSDRFRLPRVMVFDWDGETFSRQLFRWFEELNDPA